MRRRGFSWVALAGSLALALVVVSERMGQAAGTTYYVDDDYGNPHPGSGTATDPFHAIQGGIDAATSGDTVQVAAGRYYENIMIIGKPNLLIQGAGVGEDPSLHSIIDGNGSGPVVTATGTDLTTKLDGFLVTRGDATYGGGMLITYGAATVSHCAFVGNTATNGGGMAIYDTAWATVTHCTFSGNSATFGAGIYSWFAFSYTVSISDSVVAGNTGDGMYFDNGGILDVTRCKFIGNSDAGMVIENQMPLVTVTDSTFSDNGSDGIRLGHVYSSVKVHNSIFSGNNLSGIRKLFELFGRAQVEVINCVFMENKNRGFHADDAGMQLRVKNCLFWKNHGNPSAMWGGSGGNPATMINSILWGGIEKLSYGEIRWPSIAVSYSDVEMESGTFPGTGNINADPRFVDPDGPDDLLGTPDDDFRLRAGSPCIDAGTSEGAPERDMEGNDRFDDPDTLNTGAGDFTYTDMGPLEYRPRPCDYDFEPDGDVDGRDLADLALGLDPQVNGSSLCTFAGEFGRTDCPADTP
jgi:hypothetical protein